MSEKVRSSPDVEEQLERAKHLSELADHKRNGVRTMRHMVMQLYLQDQGLEQ